MKALLGIDGNLDGTYVVELTVTTVFDDFAVVVKC